MYKLSDEAKLKIAFLGSMDGNNSLKLVDSSVRCGATRQDNRTHRIKDMFLSPDEVDVFKDEVSSRPVKVRLLFVIPHVCIQTVFIGTSCQCCWGR